MIPDDTPKKLECYLNLFLGVIPEASDVLGSWESIRPTSQDPYTRASRSRAFRRRESENPMGELTWKKSMFLSDFPWKE